MGGSAGRVDTGAPAASLNAIETWDLGRRFGRRWVVHDLGLTVGSGEVYGLLGPNGAGKTTTLRMLLGLLPPSTGGMSVLGLDPTREGARLRALVGYVSQATSLYTDLTVGENLTFFARQYGMRVKTAAPRISRALDRFHLADQRQVLVGRLPTGSRRRAAMAAALLHEPRLLVLDEPTSGMDVITRREFWAFLGGLAGGGVTVIVTTHHLEEVEACDRIGLVLNGELRYEGTVSGMRAAWGDPVIQIEAEPWEEAFAILNEAFGASLFGRSVHIDRTRVDQEGVRALLAERGVVLRAIGEHRPSLDDAFLRASEDVRSAGGAAEQPPGAAAEHRDQQTGGQQAPL